MNLNSPPTDGPASDCSHAGALSDTKGTLSRSFELASPDASESVPAPHSQALHAVADADRDSGLPGPGGGGCPLSIHEHKSGTPAGTKTYDEISQESGKQGIGQLPARLQRYGRAHSRALEMASYLLEVCQGDDDRDGQQMRRRAEQLQLCGSYLEFRHYFTEDVVRLHAAMFCQQDKLCPFCAIRRGAKMLRKYAERVVFLQSVNSQLLPFMTTFTIKNRDDLGGAFKHLTSSYSALMDRGKRARNRDRVWSESALAAGSVASVEVKRGEGTRGGAWHPHIHAVWLCDRQPDQQLLQREWHDITGDSHQIDVRPFHFVREGLPATADNVAADFAEVFKYALKFSTMDVADNWHAFTKLFRRRLIFSRGLLHGLDIPDDLADAELVIEDLPFVQLIYRFSGGVYS